MKRLQLWIIDHPALMSALIAALTAFFALQIPRLEIDSSSKGLMLEKDPARQYYDQFKQRFGSDIITVILVKADDIFTAPVLRVIKGLSESLERVEGVTRIESLTTVKNLKAEADFLNTEALVGDELPMASSDLQRIRADALGNRVFVGNIVSKDARAAAIIVHTDPQQAGKEFDKRFTDQVEALIQQASAPELTIYQIGGPINKVTLEEHVRQDQLTLTPISLAVLFVILFLTLRTLQGVVIPIMTGVLSIVWGLGLMVLFDLPVTIVSAAIPALVIAIGFTEDVHMLSEYHHELEQGKDKLSAIRSMSQRAALPILVTTATTIFGFASLITADIPMISQFGYASSMALIANFIVTIVVLPLMLLIWRVPKRLRTTALNDESTDGMIPQMMERLCEFNLRYRAPIAVVAVLLTAGALAGAYRLRVNNDFISCFPESFFLRQRIQDVHSSLAGALTFHVVVETGQEDGVKDPDFLRKVANLQDFLGRSAEIDKTLSVADYLKMMHREMNGGNLALEVIPETREQVAQYLLTLDGKELAKYVDFNASTVNIVVRHNITSSWELSALLKRLEAYVTETFPQNLRVRYTGETVLINNATDFMAINQLTSFSYTFIIIGLIHALLFMSLRAGFLSMIPNVIPILFNFGLMGVLGIPLTTGTAMIASIAIGIAVDDTVHYMVTYSRQLNQHHDQKIAMLNTMKAQGRPIIYVSLALAGGFLVLAFSSFVPIFHLGVLSAVVMLVAMVVELVLTPLLMYSTRLVTLWDMVMLKLNRETLRTPLLFKDLSQWEVRKVVLLGTLCPLQPGELVIQKGDVRTEMYFVVTGQLRVFDRGPDDQTRTLALLDPGAVFGEIGLLEGVRTANVIAELPSEVLRLDSQALDRLRKRFPFTAAKLFRNLAAVLSARLRDTTGALMRTPTQRAASIEDDS
jgi:hypothetical protein